MREKKIKIPIYPGTIIIYQCNNLLEIEKKHDLTSVEGCDALTWHEDNKNGSRVFYIAFEENTKIDIIAHESVHVTNMIFKNCFVELDIDNDEPQAYLLAWIVKKCCEFLVYK